MVPLGAWHVWDAYPLSGHRNWDGLSTAGCSSRQTSGPGAWTCRRCRSSSTTTCPTTGSCTSTGVHGRAGPALGRWGPAAVFAQLILLLPKNRAVGAVRPEGCGHQLREERRHPHPAGHRAVLLHADRRDAHERCVGAARCGPRWRLGRLRVFPPWFCRTSFAEIDCEPLITFAFSSRVAVFFQLPT